MGNARAVIDRHVHILPASAAGCADAASSDAVAADTVEAPELLDVEMKQVAGALMLIALRRRLDLQCSQAIERIALKDPAHSRSGDAHVHGDAIHGPALNRLWINMEERRCLAIAQSSVDNGPNHPGSTSRRQRGIVVTVLGDLLHWVAKSANLEAPPWTTY